MSNPFSVRFKYVTFLCMLTAYRYPVLWKAIYIYLKQDNFSWKALIIKVTFAGLSLEFLWVQFIIPLITFIGFRF